MFMCTRAHARSRVNTFRPSVYTLQLCIYVALVYAYIFPICYCLYTFIFSQYCVYLFAQISMNAKDTTTATLPSLSVKMPVVHTAAAASQAFSMMLVAESG